MRSDLPAVRGARRSQLLSRLGLAWLFACLAAGGYVAARPGAQETAGPAAASPSRFVPIEQIRVGQRVVTDGGLANGGRVAADPSATAVDPATWRAVDLRVEARLPDGTADVMQVRELMPLAVLRAEHAGPGARVPVPLDLGDIDEQGYAATVEAIGPCPPIGAGSGRVVLSTVTHPNSYVFRLTVADGNGRREALGVTGVHKLYAEGRGWTSVAALRAGERLRGRAGVLTVDSVTRDPGTRPVYNLTVEGDHVYYVGTLATLSHNMLDCFGNPIPEASLPGKYPPQMPTNRPIPQGWQDGVNQLQTASGHGVDIYTPTQLEGQMLLQQGIPEAYANPQGSLSDPHGMSDPPPSSWWQTHPPEGTRNPLPHIKWKTPYASGHIYFGPEGE